MFCFVPPAGTAALPVLWEFFKLYPTADAAKAADVGELAKLLNPLGLHEKRAETIVKFSGVCVCVCARVHACVTI